MEFIKYQATGNDFILIDAVQMPSQDWPALAKTICDRHYGVGADGILLVLPSRKADYRMRIFNPDGSEAEICGNGLRCFARYIVETKKKGRNDKITIETLAGIKEAVPYMKNGLVTSVRLSMGKPSLKLSDIPAVLPGYKGKAPVLDYPLEVAGKNLTLTFVSMGNPHAVHFLREGEKVDKFPLSKIGPMVENNAFFPRRTNFEIVQVTGKDTLNARVWERGAGETMSCGSGACAIAVAARLKGLIEDEVDIKLPGGILTLSWDGKGEVILKGPVEDVFRGDWILY